MRVEYNRTIGDVYETWTVEDDKPEHAVRAMKELLPGPKEEEPEIRSSKRPPKNGEEVVIP